MRIFCGAFNSKPMKREKKKVFWVKVIVVTSHFPTKSNYPENISGIALHHLKFEMLGVLCQFFNQKTESPL
jgi:hypothetical protein